MTAGGKGRRSGVDVAAIDKENTAGMMETYGFPVWFYPIFILVVVLFAVCTENIASIAVLSYSKA